MALISAKTIITSLSLFHITLGFFFLTNPATIAEQTLVYVVGEAMGLPYPRSFESPSPALALLAFVLAFFGVADLVTLSLPEDVSMLHHWGLQAPLRVTCSFALVCYTMFFGAASDASSSSASSSSSRNRFAHAATPPGYGASGWGGDGLKNRVFFTFAFVELISWFWVWVTLREERQNVLARKATRRRSSHSSYGRHDGSDRNGDTPKYF